MIESLYIHLYIIDIFRVSIRKVLYICACLLFSVIIFMYIRMKRHCHKFTKSHLFIIGNNCMKRCIFGLLNKFSVYMYILDVIKCRIRITVHRYTYV